MNSPASRYIALTCGILASIVVVGCAMKVAPTGGPRDTTPAEVVEIEPRNGSTNVVSPTIRITFDDYVDRSVRNAISVLPAIRFQTSYAGDEVEITFTDSLVPNTTYTVTLGTTWTDIRGNTPTQSYAMVFSTGASIDSGVIAGRVYGSSLASVIVCCYPQRQFDSVGFSPSTIRPLYYQALGTTGAFTLRGLADGRYRVLAVRDENRNTLLDGTEEFCVAPSDVVVTNGKSDELRLLLGPPVDSLGPVVQRVRARSQHVISIQVSEPSWYLDRSRVVTVSTNDRRDSAQAVWLETEPSDMVMVRLRNPLDTSRHTIDVEPGLLRDSLSYPSQPTTTLRLEDRQVRGSRVPDTSRILLARRIPSDSAQDMGLGDALRIRFSQPVDTSAARFEVWHSSERGAHAVRLQWDDPTTVSIIPTSPRLPQTWYVTEVGIRSIAALNGTTLADTTLRLAHRTQVRPADPGSIRGRFIDSLERTSPNARLIVRLLNDKRRVIAQQRMDSTHVIAFDGVPPGSYAVDVFDDRNGNGRYDYGIPSPWTYGEQWWPTSATVNVRSRWTVEDLRVVLGL